MRVWSIISTIFLLLIIVAVVVFFAFEKTIPTSWAGDALKGVSANIHLQTFEEVNAMGKFGIIKDVKNYTYEGENRTKTLSEHKVLEAAVVGQNTDLIMHYKEQKYEVSTDEVLEAQTQDYYYYVDNGLYSVIENGAAASEDLAGSVWKNNILHYMQSCMPLNASGEFPYGDILENNLERITQKGVYIFAYASKDNVRLIFAYDFLNRQLKGYTEEVDTLSGETVVSTQVTTYQFTFPASITLPTAEAE